MSEWDGCYCGEFAQPTIAPDEFGETCFHEHDKCEVPTTKVPDQTVIRLLRQKVDRMTERARKAEAATSAVREACDEALHEDPMPEGDFRRGYNMAMKVVSRLLDAP